MQKMPTAYIVDDNELDCLIVKNLFEQSLSCSVEVFTSAKNALESLKSHVLYKQGKLPGVILLDVYMPLKSGWDFLTEYETLVADKNIPLPSIYLLTGFIHPNDYKRAIGHPLVKGMISKPFSAEVIEKYLHLLADSK
jgi:CheY-like chemotaxis protein